MRFVKTPALTLLLLCLASAAFAENTELSIMGETPIQNAASKPGLSTRKKMLLLQGSVAGVLLGTGVIGRIKRDNPDFRFVDDGWFEMDTPLSGADKLGHAYSTYAMSRGYSAIFRKFGLEKSRSEWEGPLSGWSTMFIMEIHDILLGFGFSYKDIIANSSGALLAFFEERYEGFDKLVDYRVEYIPSDGYLRSKEADFLSDYSGMKHLLVFKPAGVDSLNSTPLAYIEFHVGYFTEGTAYEVDLEEKDRNLYAGLAINLSEILRRAGDRSEKHRKQYHVASTIFEYYQPPYVSLDAVKSLD
jgi:hypothetical protein